MPGTPFDTIESAQAYVRFLVDALAEAREHIREDVQEAEQSHELERRLQALRLVEYKLAQLREHVTASSRLLNDLRTLRRLLLREREEDPSGQQS